MANLLRALRTVASERKIEFGHEGVCGEAAKALDAIAYAARDLTSRVLDDDHRRLCEGRNYECSCGYDERLCASANRLDIVLEAVAEREQSA